MFVYAAFKQSDMTEGRGPKILDICFMNKKDAEDYIDTKSGVMGRKAKWSIEKYGDWEVRPLMVYNSLEECTEEYNNAVKAAALAKLTDEEKFLLGLK